MVDIEKYGDFKILGKQKKKRQIILCHTSREVEEYLASLMFRYNGKYDKIPNYVITRRGKIYQLLDNNSHSHYFSDENINRNAIIISLENLGWLEKKPLTNHYINWNGSIYNEQVYEKKWREFFFWQPYTNSQIKSTVELCEQLTNSLQIEKRCIGHNTKVDGIKNYEGIITRSNFDTTFTDLNPSFNFENFIKLFENEQFTQ
jgi:N-acetyl-anhydromuramyl-L-alanine amidase AmpD